MTAMGLPYYVGLLNVIYNHFEEHTIVQGDKPPFAPRDGAGAVVFADKLWLLGGWNPMDKATFPLNCISDVWNSVDDATWTRLPDAPWEGRHTAGYVGHDGKIGIVGGDAIQRHLLNECLDRLRA